MHDADLNRILGRWEELLAGTFSPLPYRYHEWFVYKQLQIWPLEVRERLILLSGRFPLAHKLLLRCEPVVRRPFEQLFPTHVQQEIYQISRAAIALYVRPTERQKCSDFLGLVSKLSVNPLACSYYIDAAAAFAGCASIVLERGAEDASSTRALYLAGQIGNDADMTSSPAVDKLLALADELGASPAKLEQRRLQQLIAWGESNVTEFKQTMSYDVNTGDHAKRAVIEFEALKTVAAFLNSEGGTLFIGVCNSGELFGIDTDAEKFHAGSRDKLMLHWQSILDTRIENCCRVSVKSKILPIAGVAVLLIECSPSSSPAILSKEFFIRQYGRSVKLVGPELIEYQQNRFPHLPVGLRKG